VRERWKRIELALDTAREWGEGKKLKDKLTASCNFHKPGVLTIVRHFAFLLAPRGNNRKLRSGTLEGWGEA